MAKQHEQLDAADRYALYMLNGGAHAAIIVERSRRLERERGAQYALRFVRRAYGLLSPSLTQLECQHADFATGSLVQIRQSWARVVDGYWYAMPKYDRRVMSHGPRRHSLLSTTTACRPRPREHRARRRRVSSSSRAPSGDDPPGEPELTAVALTGVTV